METLDPNISPIETVRKVVCAALHKLGVVVDPTPNEVLVHKEMETMVRSNNKAA